VENEIGTLENKEKGNETLCPCGNIVSANGIGLIQFLESCYTRDCLNMASINIDEKYICQFNQSSLRSMLSSCLFNTGF
jgi:hypothetical protein